MPQPADHSQDPDDASLDVFLGGKLQIAQPRRGYRAGLDAVLLAASINAEEAQGGHLLDVGAGVGTIGLCAAQRIERLEVTLFEKQPDLCRLAQRNIALNTLSDRVRCIQGHVGGPAQQLAEAGVRADSFTHVVANPPFMSPNTGTLSHAHLKAASHALEPGQSLDDWARFLARMAKPGGKVLLIHKAAALTDLLKALETRFGALKIMAVQPRSVEPANRIIISGVKGSRAEPVLLPPLTLHDERNAVTARLDAILRHGAPLDAAL